MSPERVCPLKTLADKVAISVSRNSRRGCCMLASSNLPRILALDHHCEGKPVALRTVTNVCNQCFSPGGRRRYTQRTMGSDSQRLVPQGTGPLNVRSALRESQ